MTYSIGFRAPARSELIAHYCDHVLADLNDDDRYTDPGLRVQANSGEITAEALDALHAMVTEKLADKAAFARWFGTYNSTPKSPDIDWGPEEPVSVETVRAMLAGGAMLRRNPASRFSFVRQGEGAVLFVDGEAFECAEAALDFAQDLCLKESVEAQPRHLSAQAVLMLIAQFINRGSLHFDADD